jgi:peroxidase
MEKRRRCLWLVAALLAPPPGDAALSPDYYRSSCPDLESVVRYEVSRKINLTVVTIPATLRLVLHDCLVGVRKQAMPTVFFLDRAKLVVPCFLV